MPDLLIDYRALSKVYGTKLADNGQSDVWLASAGVGFIYVPW